MKTLREEWAQTRRVLRETPRLRILLAANLISQFNAGLLIPVLPLFLLDRGLSILQLGAAFSLVAVCAVAVQVLAGRHQRVLGRPEVVVGLLLLSVLVFPAYLYVESVPAYFLLSALGSIASAAASPGLMVLVAQAAPREDRATVFGWLGMAASFAYAAALVLGGFLLAVGFVAVFVVATALSFSAFLVLATFVLGTREARARRPKDLTPEEREAWQAVADARGGLVAWSNRLTHARAGLEVRTAPPAAAANVRWAALHLFLFGASLAVYPVYFPRHLVEAGLPLAWLGVAIASSWITFGLAQPFGARFADRTGRHRQLIVTSLLVAALLNLVLAKGSLVWILVAWVLLGIADGIGRPVTQALIVESVQTHGRGRAFGWTEAAQTAARVAAPLALAFVVTAQGIGAALVVVASVVALAVLPLLLVRPLQAETPAPAPAPAPQGEAS